MSIKSKSPKKAQEIKETDKALKEMGITEHKGTGFMSPSSPYHAIAKQLVSRRELGQLAAAEEDQGEDDDQDDFRCAESHGFRLLCRG